MSRPTREPLRPYSPPTSQRRRDRQQGELLPTAPPGWGVFGSDCIDRMRETFRARRLSQARLHVSCPLVREQLGDWSGLSVRSACLLGICASRTAIGQEGREGREGYVCRGFDVTRRNVCGNCFFKATNVSGLENRCTTSTSRPFRLPVYAVDEAPGNEIVASRALGPLRPLQSRTQFSS